MQERYRVLIPIYDGVTQLDFTGPYQFFSRTPRFEPVVASLGGEPVEADGLRFSNLADLNSQTDCDILCVPGGSGCTNAIQSEVFMASVRRLAQTASYRGCRPDKREKSGLSLGMA